MLYTLLLSLVSFRLHAEGGPPLITDDPGTPERGHWEINLGFTYAQAQHEINVNTPLVDVNYGVLENLKVGFQIPWESTVASDTGHHPSGLGGSSAGMKWRFLDEEKNKVSMSIFPQLQFGWHSFKFSHDNEPDQTHLLLPFEVAKKLGPVEVGFEYGVDLQHAHKPRDFSGVTLSHEFKERIKLLGEVRETSDLTLRQLNWIVNGGFNLKINKTIAILGSVGTTVKRADKDQPRLFSYFGIQFKF